MISFLIDRFIKSRDFTKAENRNKLISLTGYVGLFFNVFLFITKIIVGLAINSISVVSDAVNNLSDSMASIVAIVGSYYAGKPADEEHPYGHGRGEYIASLAVGIFIIIVGLTIFRSSISLIIQPEDVVFSSWAIGILLLSMAIKLYMYIYNTAISKKIDSELNHAQAIDSRNDVLISATVIASVLMATRFGIFIEGPISLVISIIIVWSGIDIFVDMGGVLLGKEVDQDTIDRLEEIVLEGDYVIGVHNIEIHEYGKDALHGTAHLEVPANIDLYSMHAIVDRLEKKAKAELNVDLSIHLDPVYCLDEAIYKPTAYLLKKLAEDEGILNDLKNKKEPVAKLSDKNNKKEKK